MHLRLPAVRLRALIPAVALLGLGAAVLVPRPGDAIRAVPPSSWSPVSDALLSPVPVTVARDLVADAVRVSPRPTNPEAGLEAPARPTVAPVPPAPPAPRPAPAVKPPSGPTHVVVAGESPWTISRRHKASVSAILRWNEGIDPRRLVIGQRLLVPGGSKMLPIRRAPVQAPARKPATRRSSAPPPSVADGNHLWPLAIRGTISRGFSAAHPALDIAAPTGTPVRAVAAGTVTWAGWKNNGGGYVVVVRHPDGMRTTYNHNSKVAVAVGDEVAAGQTIALVGETGWATGPHLDVRIEMDGRFVNPRDVF